MVRYLHERLILKEIIVKSSLEVRYQIYKLTLEFD